MLVLTRKIDESIVVGHEGQIVITIVDIRADRVRLGISAPVDIPVHRLEVFQAIEQENRRKALDQTGAKLNGQLVDRRRP